MKKFLLSIFCLFSLVGFATAEEVTVTFSEQGYENAQEVTEMVINSNLTATFDKGGNASTTPKYYNTGKAYRLYAKNTMTITANNGYIINSVSMTTGSGEYVVNAESTVTSGTLAINGTNATISDIDANEVTFTQGGSKGHVRIITLTVNYSAPAASAVATPEFSVEAGTQYNPFSVEITAEEGATVYYTLDGTEPTTESAVYSEAITFNEFGTSTTLKAIAAVDGELSNVASATYSLEVAAPAFSVKGGVYEKLTGETALQFTCETEGATIYYNNRGGDPKTEGSKSYGSLSVLSTAEVKAVAYVENAEGEKIYSAVASEKYYISPVKPFEKATTFSAGEYLIHANGFAATALSETGNYGYLPQFAVEANGNFIQTNAFYAFTFTEVEGGYTIQDTFGRYVYQTGTYNSFNVAAEMPAEGAVWTVAIDEATGEATITNTSVNKYIQYSAQYKSYGSYATAQSNAFKPSLYKLGEYPTMTVTPENWATVPAFDKVTITCESGIQYNENDTIYPYYTIGWDNTPYEFDNTVIVDENTIELTFNKPIEDNGDYRVVLPAGLFTLNPDGLAMPSAKVQNTITVENPNMLEITYANPDNGAQVKSIEYLYFEYSQNIFDQVDGAVITNENGDEFPLTVTYTDGWGESTPYNALCLKTAEPITVPGVYTFVLKKEYAYTESNVRLAEDITYTFTIVEGLKITSITPANGAEVEAIEDILIEFNKEITCMAEAFYMTSDKGAEYFLTPSFNDKDGNELPYNSIRLVAETPITAAGTYTLYIEDYNIGTTDWMNMEILPAQTLTFIIPGESGGEGEGEVDYTPTYTGNVERYDRNVTAVTLNDNRFDLLTNDQSSCYVDATETVTFTVTAGTVVKANVEHKGEWVHHAVFIDFDGDGFTAGIEEGSEWKPAGDLVAYAFYNNGGSSDEYGYNSVGTYMSGQDRHMPEIPEFTAPTEPGLYRIRFVQDWCSIDPNGDSDGKFGDFMGNGGQIIDVMLEVVEAAPELPALEITGHTPAEPVEKLETITITFSDEIEGTFDMMAMSQIYLGSRSNGCSFAVEGNVLTITPFNAITTPGEYALVIPAGLITRKANGEDVTLNGEITFTVVEPTGIEGVDAEIEHTIYDLTGRRIETITKAGIYIVNGKKV
ncbi:MAG: chitobiase/beta-hexosaminidase C-terminal domain-containing protein, partial [Bacteroidaceae bacterium]|nr:chitobiase/beta-hexosaminidase C-terminal domain-containing protein [Bacteroidaceae bacterium]